MIGYLTADLIGNWENARFDKGTLVLTVMKIKKVEDDRIGMSLYPVEF